MEKITPPKFREAGKHSTGSTSGRATSTTGVPRAPSESRKANGIGPAGKVPHPIMVGGFT